MAQTSGAETTFANYFRLIYTVSLEYYYGTSWLERDIVTVKAI